MWEKTEWKKRILRTLEKSLGVWLPEETHFATFANDKFKEKKEIIIQYRAVIF